jgi:uncharacterized protein (DUF58 family)
MTPKICFAASVIFLLAATVSCEKTTSGASDGRQLTVYQPADQSLKRGESNQVKVSIERKNFRDAVKVTFSQLPEGVVVTDHDKLIAPEETSATFTLKAEPQAPLVSNHRVDVLAKASTGLESRQAFNLTVKE